MIATADHIYIEVLGKLQTVSLLSSNGYLVDEICVLSGSSCLHICMTYALCSPIGDEIAQAVCVLCQGRQWSVEYGTDIRS